MKNNQKIKLVAVGLYVPGTGFTRVLTSLFSRLKDTFEIHWLGIGYKGAVQQKGYTLYPTNLEGGDIFGAYQMADLADEIKAEVIFILNDFWMLKPYKLCLDGLKYPATKVAYVPLDGKIDRAETIKDCAFLDHIVCYTNFALEQTQAAFNALKEKGELVDIPECHVIPHGTDLEQFYPLFLEKGKDLKSKKTVLKARLFPQISEPENSFVILNANRVAKRKALDLTIQSFELFSQNKPNTFLCLHLPGSSKEQLESIKLLVENTSVTNQIIINPLGNEYIENEQLNELYNATDVGLNTSYGEGWGMIAFEHAAAGVAQVVPDHTACGDLWKDHGVLIPTVRDIRLDNNPFLMEEISVEALTKELRHLYNDDYFFQQKSKTSYDFATARKFHWESVAQQWEMLLSKVMQRELI